MKKVLVIFIFSIFIQKIYAQDIVANSRISIVAIDQPDANRAVLTYIQANKDKLDNLVFQGQKISFDFDNLQVVKSDDRWTNIVTCKQTNGTANDFTIGFVIENNIVKDYFISKATEINGVKRTYLYDAEFNELYTVNFDESNSTASISESATLQGRNSAGGCGQATMNCINHHYTNNGWMSVALWVGTLFQPEVGLEVAVACGATCCLHIGCPQSH